MVRRICVRAIIFHEGKLLVVRNKDKQGKPLQHLNLVGGRLEFKEELKEGLQREILEELGVYAEIGNLLFIQQFCETVRDEDRDYLELFFHITNAGDLMNIDIRKSSHGSLEIAEIKYVDLSKDDEVLPSFLRGVDVAEAIRVGQVTIVSYPNENLSEE